ncbi:HAD hydrolase-like protein [Paenibacillus qinlingensis]|uniref:FMN phosphatase YigB (HAD superfamily) n=1 Tax=Paenibacillus qinlingensis TaxID=1837343 RepID=A0ABU1NT59_9BACL|nr:HAD hydrolase-like protein [Paenibacillus qinlingensis]MDR6550236.1 FMN phosphatase YigB (HAD superfamily) [Paenibacillus qinlingensis]
MEWLSDIKVIIFDMDGTLYQEDTFMDRYIRYLLEGTEWEQDTQFSIASSRKILSGNHTIKLGHFYHKLDDVALVQNAGRFVHGFLSNGDELEGQEFAEKYAALSIYDTNLIYMGDPWGIVNTIRHKCKIHEEQMKIAFERVREEMILEPYQFGLQHDLFQTIHNLTAIDRKILMTNTYEKSGIDFLHYMQIHHMFNEIYCGADKPFGIQKYMASLLEQGYHAHEVLSIGDNPWNDLYPVKQAGGRTCFISPYQNGDNQQWDLRLHTLDELKQLMQAIQNSTVTIQV